MADTATIASAILVPVEIPIRIKFFSLIFVLIHTNEFIKLLYKLCSTNSYTVWFLYQFIQFVYELYSTYSYKVWCRECAGRAARGEARAHLLPRPGRTRLPQPLGYTWLPRPVRVCSWGCWVRNGIKVYNLYYRLPRPLGYTQLPRPLGYTRLPRPVRVHSWGDWVRNGIKVYNLYYRLPRPLGYAQLPWPLGYTRLPRYTNLYSTIRIIIRSSEKWDCTNSFVWHNGQPLKKNRLFGTRIFGFLKNVRNSSLSTYYWPIQLCSHFFFLLKDELFLSWRLQYIKQTSSWDASNGSGIVLWNTEYFA